MEGNQFDALARRMATGASRRRVLKGIVGGLTALVAGGAATRTASARTITICHATGNPDDPFESLTINQAEFNLHARHGDYIRVECCADDDCPNQYGPCGTGVCQNGYCVQLPAAAGTSCDDGLYCNGDAVCDGAFTCVPGPEVVCPETGNPCTASVCDESARGCIDVAVNEGNQCGGSWCEPDVCRNGACVTEPVLCPATSDPCTITRCDEAMQRCVDEAANEGNQCGGDWCEPAICRSGACVTEPVVCPEPTNPCMATHCDASSQSCVEAPANEGSRCGGTWCNPGICRSGACVTEPVTCLSTSDPCTIIRCDDAAEGCIQVPNNEGGRCGGDPCEPAFCRSGACSTEPVVCTPVDQCHTSTCNSADGQCDTGIRVNEPCTTGDSQPGACDSAGNCVALVSCTDGIKNGAETDIDCGGGTCPKCANGKLCGINADCVSDVCVSGICVNCPADQTDCGNMCVDLTGDPNNCGACGIICSVANGTGACTNGTCDIAQCNAGFANCDGYRATGCETNISHDTNNCGFCGNSCHVANGISACVDGNCDIAQCNVGYANCDWSRETGCETNITNDPNNCGACGNVCTVANGTGVCSNGACVVAFCNPGYANCDGNPATGCETTVADDINHCGACGHACTVAPHAQSMICVSGVCKVEYCADGYGDCDGLAPNGCETPLNGVDNCGFCGNVCPGAGNLNANVTCNNGDCGFTCPGEFYDADFDVSNGCEVQSSPIGNHTQGTAQSIYAPRCNAIGPVSVDGVFPSDAVVHENPAVVGFEAWSGSAPHWYVAPPGPPVSCNDDMQVTLSLMGSGHPTCYRLEVAVGSAYYSADTNAGGIAVITGPGGVATNTSNVYFTISKTCDTHVTEAPQYHLQFRL